jgi:uncharacterized protein YjbI with pentapeptide repeats
MTYVSVSICDLAGKVLLETEVLDQGKDTCQRSPPDGLYLEGAELMMADLQGANLRKADLYWALMQECDLRSACLAGASLRGANLQGANFSGADLTCADFSQDNLGGATTLDGCDFSHADVNGAVWYGAVFDGDTVFPDGFDPFKHEMYCPHKVCGRADHRGYQEWAEERRRHWPVRFQHAH